MSNPIYFPFSLQSNQMAFVTQRHLTTHSDDSKRGPDARN